MTGEIGATRVELASNLGAWLAALHQLQPQLPSYDFFFFFISLASWRAITAFIATAVTSPQIPASSSQLSKLEPMCGFFLAMTDRPLVLAGYFVEPSPHGLPACSGSPKHERDGLEALRLLLYQKILRLTFK